MLGCRGLAAQGLMVLALTSGRPAQIKPLCYMCFCLSLCVKCIFVCRCLACLYCFLIVCHVSWQAGSAGGGGGLVLWQDSEEWPQAPGGSGNVEIEI